MCPITGDESFVVAVAVVERGDFRIGKVVVQGRGGCGTLRSRVVDATTSRQFAVVLQLYK